MALWGPRKVPFQMQKPTAKEIWVPDEMRSKSSAGFRGDEVLGPQTFKHRNRVAEHNNRRELRKKTNSLAEVVEGYRGSCWQRMAAESSKRFNLFNPGDCVSLTWHMLAVKNVKLPG